MGNSSLELYCTLDCLAVRGWQQLHMCRLCYHDIEFLKLKVLGMTGNSIGP